MVLKVINFPSGLITTCTRICTLLPGNQRFYRQITSREKGSEVSG